VTRQREARERLTDERGSVLVWFTIWLPALLIIAVLVIDVGNWFVHRRHLQTQVDAAALAGGGNWAFPCSAGVNTGVEAAARNYAGKHDLNLVAEYNDQLGGTPPLQMHMLINSEKYWNEGGTNYSDVESPGTPCEAGFLDVKGTEEDLPYLMPFAGTVVPAINAHARVTILAIKSLSGSMPIFVRDINPVSAAAIFVSEPSVAGTGGTTKLDAQYLTKAASTSCSSGFACWDNSLEPASVNAANNNGLVIALSSLPKCDLVVVTGCMSLAGSPDTICTQFAVECYWSNETTGVANRGLVYLRGYSSSNPALDEPPGLAAVELFGLGSGLATCPVGSFDFRETGTCTMEVSADVLLPPGVQADRTTIRMFAPGCNNQGCVMTPSGGRYTALVDVDAALDPPTIPIEITWEIRQTGINVGSLQCLNGGQNPCEGTFGDVQRAFSASDPTSGPIRDAQVTEGGLAVSALTLGGNHSLVASIRLAGSVATDSGPPVSALCPTCTGDPEIRLRVVAGSQSAIDCEPNANFHAEMTRGCRPIYEMNDRLSEPDPCDPPYGANQQDLFDAPQPWDCVAVGPGASVGQFTDGLLGRVFNGGQECNGGNCPNPPAASCADPDFVGRNNWNPSPNPYSWGLDPADPPTLNGFPTADPRIVILFMVPFGAFRSQGRALFPISNFGAFYITDWGGNGQDDDPCGSTGTVPTGWLAGHFIKYVAGPNTGGGSGACEFSTTTTCVAVLTE
jgi:hypothetical protein